VKIARTARFKKAWQQLGEEEKTVAQKAIRNLAVDIRYPSLRARKIKEAGYVWEARASRSLRLTFQIEGDTIPLRNIGHHDETLQQP